MRVIRAFQSTIQSSHVSSLHAGDPVADRIRQSFRRRRLAADERERGRAAAAYKYAYTRNIH